MVSAAADSSQPAVASAAFLEGSEMHALRCSELRCSELLISGARGGISPISPTSNGPRRSRKAPPRRSTSRNSPTAVGAASAPAVGAASPATKIPVKPSGGGGGGSGGGGGGGRGRGSDGAAVAVALGPTAAAGAPAGRRPLSSLLLAWPRSR